MKLAFAQVALQSRGDTVYLVHGGEDHTGQAAWYFILVDSAKVRAFLKAIDSGTADLQSYGTILESGYGKEPPYSVLQHMREQYGYTG
ncbi:MAG: hypothetical protein KGL39_29105 [Patescibacteria group bacterium]|nr:hypothetical protein [Patescibacteria group bacterium]